MADKQEIALRDKRHLVAVDVAVKPPDDAADYAAALWATGVKVLGWQYFGSYQGDWWAHVEFPNGERYFVNGDYGSCSVCDAFQAEFESGSGFDEPCERPDYLHRLRDFGLGYLTNCMTYEQAVSEASENLEWDHDAEEMVNWIKSQGEAA